MTDNAEQANQQAQAPQQHVAAQKIYVKDISFETPNVPEMFVNPSQNQPNVNFQMATEHNPQPGNLHEVVLKITVTVTLEEKTAFLVEVAQAGLFVMTGIEEEHMPYIVNSYCPNILFPFVREAISDLVVRGGFPQLLLEPINFDAVYKQQLQQAQAQAAEQGTSVN